MVLRPLPPFEFLCTPLYLIMITMAKPRPLLEVSEPANKDINRENRERERQRVRERERERER